jgi:hypothetical protein
MHWLVFEKVIVRQKKYNKTNRSIHTAAYSISVGLARQEFSEQRIKEVNKTQYPSLYFVM